MKMRNYLLSTIGILLLGVSANAATFTLDTTTLYGLPGDTVGWGFTITSTPDTTYDNGNTPYLVITGADFVLDPGSYPVGVFTPFIIQSFQPVGYPAGNGEVNPWTQTFDEAQMTGIGSYEINDFQSIGDTATGKIELTFDEYSVSPNSPLFDPDLDGVAYGQTISAMTTVIVGPAPVTVPEPAPALAIGGGLLLAIAARRRRS
jgi:hypothetical protein